MFIAKVIDNQITDTGHLNLMFPDTSFPSSGPSQEWLDNNNCKQISMWKSYDTTTQKLSPTSPYLEDGVVYGIQIEDKTQEELDQDRESAAAKVRAQRNRLLAESDWTQGKDIPDELSSVWAIYRQELRDITDQPGFPYDVKYPDIPTNE